MHWASMVVPMAMLMNSLGDTIQDFITRVQTNAVEIPPPPDRVAAWPFVGAKLHATWSRAHDDLPGLVQSLQPKIGELAKAGLTFVASIAGALLLFLASIVLAGIFMAFGEPAAQACQSIFQRLVGKERGEEFTNLSAATIRAVAQGVVGVALIQAICRRLPADRQCALGRRIGRDRIGPGHCSGTGRDRHAAGDRLHLDQRHL